MLTLLSPTSPVQFKSEKPAISLLDELALCSDSSCHVPFKIGYYSFVGLVQNWAALLTTNAISGLVLLKRYRKLPTTAWYNFWLQTSSGFSQAVGSTSGFTGKLTSLESCQSCEESFQYTLAHLADQLEYFHWAGPKSLLHPESDVMILGP